MNAKEAKRFIKLIATSFLCVLMFLGAVTYKTNTVHAEEETDVLTYPDEDIEEESTSKEESNTDYIVEKETPTADTPAKEDETPTLEEEKEKTTDNAKMAKSAPMLGNRSNPDTTWQNDWDYVLDEEEGKIYLELYQGYETELVVPAKAKIDGKEYNTYLSTQQHYSAFDYWKTYIEFDKVSFEEGVKAAPDASFLFYDARINELDVSNLDTSETTNMAYMFGEMKNITYLDVSNLDTTNVDFTKGGSQANMFINIGGYGYETTVVAAPGSPFANNVRTDSEYKYPGYSPMGNYGITGPDGVERVFCLNNHLEYPSQNPNAISNYYKLIDQEEYLGAAYKKDADIIPEGETWPLTKSLTEDDLAKIAAAILYAENANNRLEIEASIYAVTEADREGRSPNSYFDNYVLPNYEALKGNYKMHIYVSEDPNFQNLVSVTRVYHSGAVLSISKETKDEPKDLKTEFELTLTVKGEDGNPLANYTVDVEIVTDTVEDHVLELDDNGQTKFKIHSGQTVKIYNLPIGSTYKIEESETKGYKLVDSEKLEGTIAKGENAAKLVNEYIVEDSVKINGLKVLEGREFKSGDTFTFTISGSDGAPLPENTSVTIKPESGKECEFAFDEIKFTNKDIGKTYTYTVVESGSGKGIENDTAKHTVSVTLKLDESGKLKITCEYSDGEQLVFTNKFKEEKKGYTIPKTGVE